MKSLMVDWAQNTNLLTNPMAKKKKERKRKKAWLHIFHSSSQFGEQNIPYEWTVCGNGGDELNKKVTW